MISIIAIIGAVVSSYIIPWLRETINEKELDRLIYFATVAVKFANQTFTPEQWQEKKAAVTEYLQDVIAKKINITITAEDLDKIIEAIVYEVKQEAAKGN